MVLLFLLHFIEGIIEHDGANLFLDFFLQHIFSLSHVSLRVELVPDRLLSVHSCHQTLALWVHLFNSFYINLCLQVSEGHPTYLRMIVKLDTFQRNVLVIITLILLDFALIYGGLAHFHQDAPHQLPLLVQGVRACRICYMRDNACLGVEHQHVVRRARSLQVNQLPCGCFKEFWGQVGVVYKIEELIVTSQEPQYRELTSLIISPLFEDG